VATRKGFLVGRAATVLLLSGDGTKLFVTGVGDAIQVVDPESFEVKRTIQLGRDLMANPLPLPARIRVSGAPGPLSSP
jgi:DNA-binding beta-propeller fold protein YncE